MTGRYYKIDTEHYPSVTTIISAVLPNAGIAAWRLRVGAAEAERICLDATEHGTGVHALVEMVNRGRRANLTVEQDAIVAPYIAWLDVHVETVIGAEKLLVSRQHGYAGTTDLIAIMAGDRYPAIVDFKTSKTALGADEWRLQLAAYVIAAEEHLGLVCRRRIIVRLSRTEPDRVHIYEVPEETLADDRSCFLALLKVFQWQQVSGTMRTPSSTSIGRIVLRRNGR